MVDSQVTQTKAEAAYERALKRAQKAKEAFDKLPELNAEEKELCLQYINNLGDYKSDQHLLYGGSMPKLKAMGSYKKRTGLDLSTAKERIEEYIRTYRKV